MVDILTECVINCKTSVFMIQNVLMQDEIGFMTFFGLCTFAYLAIGIMLARSYLRSAELERKGPHDRESQKGYATFIAIGWPVGIFIFIVLLFAMALEFFVTWGIEKPEKKPSPFTPLSEGDDPPGVESSNGRLRSIPVSHDQSNFISERD